MPTCEHFQHPGQRADSTGEIPLSGFQGDFSLMRTGSDYCCDDYFPLFPVPVDLRWLYHTTFLGLFLVGNDRSLDSSPTTRLLGHKESQLQITFWHSCRPFQWSSHYESSTEAAEALWAQWSPRSVCAGFVLSLVLKSAWSHRQASAHRVTLFRVRETSGFLTLCRSRERSTLG